MNMGLIAMPEDRSKFPVPKHTEIPGECGHAVNTLQAATRVNRGSKALSNFSSSLDTKDIFALQDALRCKPPDDDVVTRIDGFDGGGGRIDDEDEGEQSEQEDLDLADFGVTSRRARAKPDLFAFKGDVMATRLQLLNEVN